MVTSPRYRALTAPGWTRDPLWTRARMMPSFDIDANFSALPVDRISGQNLTTFTRAASATYVDVDGVIRTAGANVLRRQWDATNQRWGWLVEEARTNSIRNNTMGGAVAGTPGTLPTNWSLLGGTGLATEVVGTGTENGITYLDFRFSGTTGTTFTGLQLDGSISGLTTATTYTASVYLKRTAGSLTNLSQPSIYIRYNLTPSGQTDISAAVSSLAAPSANLVQSRYSATGTTAGTLSGIGAVFVLFSHSSGVAVDLTLRIGLPQLEQGAFATSPILTSGSTATRDADVWSVTGTSFSRWYRQDESTIYVDCALPEGSATSSSATRTVVDLTDGTVSNRLAIRSILNAALTDQITTRSNGGTALNLTTGATVGTTPRKIATGFRASDYAAAGTGASSVATLSSGAMPLGVNQMTIGSIVTLGNANYHSGTISRLTYWPARLSNPVLQELSR